MPADPVDVIASTGLEVVGRVVSFFGACFIGFALAKFAAQFDGVFDFLQVWTWVDTVPRHLAEFFFVPMEWGLALFVGPVEKPLLLLGVPFYFFFAYKMFWTDGDVLWYGTWLVVFEGVHAFYHLGRPGWGLVVLVGLLSGVVILAWLYSRWQYEREMRRLEAIERTNAAKRAAKKKAEREAAELAPAPARVQKAG